MNPRHSQAKRQHDGSAIPDLFVPTAKEKKIVQVVQADVYRIVQASYPETDALIAAIEAAGVPVVRQGPELPLKLSLYMAGAAAGFIAPSLPRYADLVTSLVQYAPHIGAMETSHGVLVLLKGSHGFMFLTYQLYHALAYRSGLEGYQEQAIQLYNTFNRKHNGQLHPKLLEKLDMQGYAMLKMAIRRDKEALTFVRQMMHEVFIPTNNSKRLHSGEAQA